MENRQIERDPAQGEVVEGDVEETAVCIGRPLECLRRAIEDGVALGEPCFLLRFASGLASLALRLRQEQVAIPEALNRIEERVFGWERLELWVGVAD